VKVFTKDQIKFDAKDLAGIAIDHQVPVTLLRSLYDMVETRNTPDMEVCIKSQMDKALIPREFGDELLQMIEKYATNKQDMTKFLRCMAFELYYLYSELEPRKY